MSDWHQRAVCPKCGWHTYAPFGILFHVHHECCPECGCPKPDSTWKEPPWQIKTMCFMSDATWFKPWTWGTGHWETRGSK